MRPSRVLIASSLPVLALTLLLGCTPEPEPQPTESSAPPQTPDPTPTETETAAPPGPAVDVPCDQLVSADTVYAFNPQYALLDTFPAPSGSPAADDVEAGGVACEWTNTSSGVTIDVSVAGYSPDELTSLKNDAFTSGDAVPTYQVDEAYFAIDGRVGRATAFLGDYRITAESEDFLEPGDVTTFIDSAAAALG